jgi:hypothetical protein
MAIVDRLPDWGPLYTVRQQQLFEVVTTAKHINLVRVKSGITLQQHVHNGQKGRSLRKIEGVCFAKRVMARIVAQYDAALLIVQTVQRKCRRKQAE